MYSQFVLRPIRKEDNPQVAQVIRDVMTSYQCIGDGFSISDPEVDMMYEAYNHASSVFYIITDGDKVLGCGGIAPLEGGAADTCELKKMYFYPELRAKGYGRQLMETLLDDAKKLGYKKCYLETVDRMQRANQLYKKYGFEKLPAQQGHTGHSGCDTFYIRSL